MISWTESRECNGGSERTHSWERVGYSHCALNRKGQQEDHDSNSTVDLERGKVRQVSRGRRRHLVLKALTHASSDNVVELRTAGGGGQHSEREPGT